MIAHHSHGKIATSHRLKRVKQVLRRVRLSVGKRFGFCPAASGRWRGWAEIAHEIPPWGKPLEFERFAIETAADSQIKWKQPAKR
jgi:hypothetical protein